MVTGHSRPAVADGKAAAGCRVEDHRKRMLKPYIVYFKFKIPGDKTEGAVKQFRVYANNLDEAKRLAVRHANYPNVEVLTVKPA